MSKTNYDTRPTAPPLFGSDHTEQPRYVPDWMAFATWFFGVAAVFGTIAWIGVAGIEYFSITTEAFIAMGVATIALWLVTALLIWLPRRH